ncbi:endonuclease [Rhodococcus aerolatus]
MADDVLTRLLDRHGRTFADEAGISLRDEPAPLFQLLVLTHVLSANISADLGVRAATALKKAYRSAHAMADATEDDVFAVLNEARFLRKHRTAAQLVQTAQRVVDEWDDDLRGLRDAADGDPGRVRDLVTDFPGIGAVGADIFCREAQAVWPSLRPFVDDRVLGTATALGLPGSADGLAEALGDDDLAVLGAALVRCERAADADELRG